MSPAGTVAGTAATVRHRGLIMLSLMLAVGMQALDTTIANVALPRIQGSLSGSSEQMSWVLTAYIVASAIALPLSAWLINRVGRRTMLMVCIAGFVLASASCGLAQSLPQIVAARVLQGVTGAALMPLTQSTLLDINPPERHARAMSLWAMGITLGPILGPVLGGWLTDFLSWRWIFFINVPLGAASILGIWLFVPDSATRRSRFDTFGFLSLTMAIAGAQLLLDRGQSIGWFDSMEAWIESGAAVLGLYLFVVHLLGPGQDKFVDIRLFRDWNFVAGTSFSMLASAVLTATLALLPLLLQSLLHYPTFKAGLAIAPRGIGALLTMMISPWLARRMDSRVVMCAGFAVMSLAGWQMIQFSLDMDARAVMLSGFLQGAGMGLAFVPLISLPFATLPSTLRSSASAMSNLLRSMGSSLGVSVVTAQLARTQYTMHARLAEHVSAGSIGASSSGNPPGLAVAWLDGRILREATMIGYRNDFKMMFIACVCLIVLSALLKPARASSPARSQGA